MSTTIQTFITELDARYANSYTDANKLSWINDMELALYEDPDMLHEYRTKYYHREKNVYQLSLPSNVLFENVFSLWVEDKQYNKNSQRHNEENYSFWYENSKINIYPVPTETDAEYVSGAGDITFKAITYTSGAGEITFTSSTITTTGSSFETAGFVVGNTVEISGCTENTGNNKTATITAVAADTLTFSTGDFEAGAETGAITIKTNCIYTEGHNFSGFSSGDTILVSGCEDETANNKYARITAVADAVLTFATGTFTAQAETAAVTIQEVNIKLVYRYVPTEKAIGDISTDTLLLPRRFEPAYYYYCYAQMAYLNREFDEYNNHMRMYNSAIADYIAWYEERKPMAADLIMDDGWGDTDETSDFDEC